jgi:hypothetical protein
MKSTRTLLRVAGCIALAVPSVLLGQDATTTFLPTATDASSNSAALVTMGTTPAVKDDQALTARWLDLDTLSWSGRYRKGVNSDGRAGFQAGQDRYIAAGRLKLDAEGRYSIHFQGSSGRYFNWAYADEVGTDYAEAIVAGRPYHSAAFSKALSAALLVDPNGATYKAGFPTRGGYFYLRQLYASATPINAVTFEFGSLPIDRGQNSEITSFDDDGWITGERVRVQDPKHLYFDRMDATFAYLGSFLTPNFLARGTDLTKSNYQQYLVEKKIGKHVVASTDFTELSGTHTLREAVAIKTTRAKLIDSARVELYQRTNAITLEGTNLAAGSGFAVSASKLLARRVNFTAGYDTIDRNYTAYGNSIYLYVVGNSLNGDAYGWGRRGFAKTEIRLANGITASGFYSHLIPTADPTTVAGFSNNRQGYNGGLNFDLKALANSGRKVF